MIRSPTTYNEHAAQTGGVPPHRAVTSRPGSRQRGVGLARLAALAIVPCCALVLPALESAHARGHGGDGGGGFVAMVLVGKGDKGLEARLRSSLEDAGLDLMSAPDFLAAARSAGVSSRDLSRPAGIREASAAAEVDAVLVIRTVRSKKKKGRRKKKRSRVLQATLYDAQGRRLWGHRLTLKGRGPPAPRQLRRLVAGVGEQTRLAAAQKGPRPFSEEAIDAVRQTSGRETASRQPDPRPEQTASRQPDPRPEEQDDGGRGSQPSDGLSLARSLPQGDWTPSRPPFVTARLLAGAARRRYYASGPPVKVESPFTTSPHVGVLLEVAPLASLGRVLQGLSLETAYSRTLISSVHAPSAGEPQKVSTPSHRLHLDVRYQLRLFTSSPYGPTVGVRGGWGFRYFQVPEPTREFFGVYHKGVRVGADLAQPVPFLADVVSFTLGGTYMPSQTKGPAELQVYGTPVSAMGFGVRAGLSSNGQASSSGFSWGVWGELTYYLDQYPVPTNSGSTKSSGGVRRVAVPHTREYFLAAYAGLGYAF